jgi:AcrR family transcriptional regulator
VSPTPSHRPEKADRPVKADQSGNADRPAKGGRYHHGDLKEALIDAAMALITERGVRSFSLAEVSRRLGVTVAAPYRHFADRDDLLAAVAVRAVNAFAAAVDAEAREAGSAEERLAAMARGYVRFAAEQRPLFDMVYDSGLDKHRYPELRLAYAAVDDAFLASVQEITGSDPAQTSALETALEAAAHGYAMLLIDGTFGDGADAIRTGADQAAGTVLAIIEGRRALGHLP